MSFTFHREKYLILPFTSGMLVIYFQSLILNIFHLEASDIPVAEVFAQLLHLHIQHDDGGNDEDDEDDAKDNDNECQR